MHQDLLWAGLQRVTSGYRPKTLAAQNTHLSTFVQFCEFIGVSHINIDPGVVIAFIEYLVLNDLTHGTILGYISSLKQCYKMYNLCHQAFEHEWVRLAMRGISRTVLSSVRVKAVFDVQQVLRIVEICDTVPYGVTYKCVFLTALFGFLRLSNLVPTSSTTFNVLEHLARGDIFSGPTHWTMLVKWSKTLQKSSQFATVQLPVLKGSPLCPVRALQTMLHQIPLGNNSPMFCYLQGNEVLSLTQSKVRKMLKDIVSYMGLSPERYPFHTFRRTGASWAFSHSSSIQAIQQQGTWTSDAV